MLKRKKRITVYDIDWDTFLECRIQGGRAVQV